MLTEIAIAADKVMVAGMLVLGQGRGWDRGGMVKIEANKGQMVGSYLMKQAEKIS
jgi:hypothetical protein